MLDAAPGHLRRESECRALLCWTLVAFALRLLLVWRVEQVISPDGVQYVTLAQNLVAGNLREGLSTYWPPLYPLLVGLSSLVFGDAELAGRLVSVLAGSLTVIPAYALIRKWYGGRVALVGACIVALHPVLVYYSTVLLTEATYTLLFTCGVLAGWSALSGVKARAYFAAGAAFGACYLLKPEAVGFLLLLLALVSGRKLFDRTHALGLAARNAFSLCAGFLSLAGPYLFYLRQQTGSWIISGKTAEHLLQGSRRAGGEVAPLVPALISELMPFATNALVQMTKALRFEYELFNLLFPVFFILLAALGLFRERWTRERALREAYLFSFVAATLAGYALTLPNVRFLVPLLPLLLCWVSKGVVEFEGWTNETLASFQRTRGTPLRGGLKFLVSLVVAALLASLLPVFVYLLRGDKWGDYYGQKRAAAWIKEHDAERAPVIMSTVPVAAFYAGGRHVKLADEDYAALISRARREGVKHVVVNERDFRHMRLRTLLEDGAEHPGLRLSHSLSEAPGHRVLVYAVEGIEDARDEPQEVRVP
jgi:4-amino-4-deoxy-L-arabinose transferase-like glycosyltransferase